MTILFSVLLKAIRTADAIVICPSNPWVSIDPILAVPGVRDTINTRQSARQCSITAVSPIIAGATVKGPAAKMMRELGLKPLVRIVASAAAGVNPRTMGLGPIPATRKALERAGLKLDDIGLIELNEAFAVQSLAVMRELGMRHEITNVNGGAVALGHPLGMSGARILGALVHEMKRRAPAEKRPYYGLATLCVGVGQGEATIVEWVD